MKYSNRLVLKVNEIFHDVESNHYKYKHPEIFKRERDRWKRNVIPLIVGTTMILDIGTGTGFVPNTICSRLNKKDAFICSDISKEMLEICKRYIYWETGRRRHIC